MNVITASFCKKITDFDVNEKDFFSAMFYDQNERFSSIESSEYFTRRKIENRHISTADSLRAEGTNLNSAWSYT